MNNGLANYYRYQDLDTDEKLEAQELLLQVKQDPEIPRIDLRYPLTSPNIERPCSTKSTPQRLDKGNFKLQEGPHIVSAIELHI